MAWLGYGVASLGYGVAWIGYSVAWLGKRAGHEKSKFAAKRHKKKSMIIMVLAFFQSGHTITKPGHAITRPGLAITI